MSFSQEQSLHQNKKKVLFHFLGHYEALIRMHKMFLVDTLPTLDLLQVEEVRASFLVGRALGNGVKNEFVQESDDKMYDCLIYPILPVLFKCGGFSLQSSLSPVPTPQNAIPLHVVIHFRNNTESRLKIKLQCHG